MPTALIVGLIVFGALVVISGISYLVNPPIMPTDDGTLYIGLSPGTEAFTLKPLTNGERYKVTLSGLYEYRASWGWHRADGCYKAAAGNFTERYRKLYFDGALVDTEPFDEDRFLHIYSFVYKGTGKRLAVLLYPPKNNSTSTLGSLSLTISILSQAETLVVDEAERERERGEAEARLQAKKERLVALRAAREQEQKERQRQEDERRRQDAARVAKARQQAHERAEQRRTDAAEQKELQQEHEIKIRDQVNRLRIRSRLEGNVLDPHYRESLTTHHREKILASKAIISDGYAEFMTNEELVEAARQQAPEVLDFMEALVELVQLAERKEAEPKPAPSLPPARIKLTEAQVRARKAHRKIREARDVAAEKRALLDSAIEFKESLQGYPLEEDEKMRLSQDYYDAISTQEAENGKKLD